MTETPVVLHALTEDECWDILEHHDPHLGRIGFTHAGTQVVYPMNYAVADRTLYLRTDPNSRLTAVVGSHQVAFEVDEVDSAWERGWSVLAQGHLHEVEDLDELDARRDLRLRAWAPGRRLHLLRMDVVRMTGRRIG